MKLRIILLKMVCFWCLAEKTNAQSTPQSDLEKEKSIYILVQQHLRKYKQDLNNAMDRNDYAAAIANLNHILLYEPDNGQALYLRARGFENIGLYERAIFDYDNAQLVGYNDPQLYYFLARLEIKAGLGKESFDSFNEFFRTQPTQIHKKELRFERGVAAKMAKEYKACVEDMSFVINEGKDEADAYFNRGICFTELNILKEAKLDFREAARIKPALRDHWYYITYDRIYKNNCKLTPDQKLSVAKKQFDKGDYFDAFIAAQNGLKCYPENKALMVLQLDAMLTQIDNYYDETIVFYQDFVKQHGVDEAVQQRMDKAIASRKQISVSDKPYDANYPNNTELPKRFRKLPEYISLIKQKINQNSELQTALEYANIALRIEPKNETVLLLRANIFLLMNNSLETALAWRDANNVLKIKPALTEAITIRTQALQQENNTKATAEIK